ncbi:thermosome subunit [Candidatus Woesearchaeota archaeon]|nr:thermosome subunit [Candidatus Woesearchaeota archaeon]
MTNPNSTQPIFILPPDTQRTTGKNAQQNNIMAAKLVAETVRTTLGPKGMDKMIVDTLGEVIVTNDGATILKEIQIDHPTAKMIVEVAKTQESEVGDGTTTVVVLAGELLSQAEDLLDQKIHPTIIAKGYRMAAEKAQLILNNIAETIDPKDQKILKKICQTAMTGKGAETARELLSEIVSKAVIDVADEHNGLKVNPQNIKIEKKTGGGVEDTELVEGIILDKEKVHSSMPSTVHNAKILLLDASLEVKETEIDAKIQITDPSQMQAFLDMEENMLKKMVDRVVASGANVIFCQKGIDDLVQHYLAKNNVFAARRVKKSDMEKLARATGAKIVNNLEDLSSSDLGKAGVVEEKTISDEEMIYVKECKKAKAVTILVRGGTEHIIDEVARAIEDAIGDLIAVIDNGKIVAGAGAPEVELSRNLQHFGQKLPGREQLAVNAFAKAMEIIPRTLAENAGFDPIDILAELKAAHQSGKKWAGVNVFTGKTMDAYVEGVLEPLKVKTQAVQSAAEVANMILRIDDVIAGGVEQAPPQGMPPGMPPM